MKKEEGLSETAGRVYLRKVRGRGVSLLSLMLVVLLTGEAFALQAIKMNMERMAKQSGRIVEGVVSSSSESSIIGPGGKQVPVMEYTLSVSTSLKGKADGALVVRHIKLPGMSGFPTYKTGEHLILFLTQESPIGLSAPVGLMQGVFRVQADKKGESVRVVNGINNAGLFEGMDNNGSGKVKGIKSSGMGRSKAVGQASAGGGTSLSSAEGPISYAQFISVVNSIVGIR